ncbi:MAG: sigma-70 family RNA polymerase sigma factor [Candidatus Omnitrophica bacterium]|nr:sigma-70 family RNA polymerase sigma factor [Candidatus Omnitrophota bacterium]
MIEFMPSDDILVERAKAGERAAFDELYQKYKRPILNYIYRFIGKRAQAEELTQEAFVRAYINMHKFEPKAKFSSWLYRIAANLSKNFLRHAQYEKRFLPFKQGSYDGEDENRGFIENIEDSARKPDEIAQASEAERFLQAAMDKLPVHLKEALILCDIKGASYEEAAKIMRCRPMTVGSRISRARQKLAVLLGHLKNGEASK